MFQLKTGRLGIVIPQCYGRQGRPGHNGSGIGGQDTFERGSDLVDTLAQLPAVVEVGEGDSQTRVHVQRVAGQYTFEQERGAHAVGVVQRPVGLHPHTVAWREAIPMAHRGLDDRPQSDQGLGVLVQVRSPYPE